MNIVVIVYGNIGHLPTEVEYESRRTASNIAVIRYGDIENLPIEVDCDGWRATTSIASL